jgi:hypothetical protein
MKAFVIFSMLFLCSSLGLGQHEGTKTLGEIEQWRLSTPHGDVRLKLSNVPSGSDTRTVLSLEPFGGSKPTTGEEEALLRQVLHDMTEHGYDPGKLLMISTWLQNSEFQDGVEHAVSESVNWKSCLGRKYCYKAEIAANHFLSSVDAFKGFDAVLHEYRLRRKAVRVDDMGVGSKAGGVLCQGLVVISLEREN